MFEGSWKIQWNSSIAYIHYDESDEDAWKWNCKIKIQSYILRHDKHYIVMIINLVSIRIILDYMKWEYQGNDVTKNMSIQLNQGKNIINSLFWYMC